MNYVFNKNSRFSRIGENNRYIVKNIKIQESAYNRNIFRSHEKMIKPNNNIYNSNYVSSNEMISKDLLNYKKLVNRENSRKLMVNRPSNSIDNHSKFLYITNFKNIQPKIYKKQDDNKISKDKDNESIPTMVKIQKLIEKIRYKNNLNNEYDNQSPNKENNKLPDLINKSKASIDSNNVFSNKSANKVLQKIDININNINNNNGIFPKNDNKNNKTRNFININKIKLKHIIPKKSDLFIINKSNSIINKSASVNTTKRVINDNVIPKSSKEKVNINNVKNIIKHNFIVNNNGYGEKIVNIRLKMNPRQTKNNFEIYNIENSSIYNNINITNKKENVKFCMSNYDNYKNDLMTLKRTFHHFDNNINKRETLFNKNKTMFRNPINDKKYNEENEEDEDESENDTKNYSKYYLPSSGFGLLTRHNNNQ
jgi:hypothetical protein